MLQLPVEVTDSALSRFDVHSHRVGAAIIPVGAVAQLLHPGPKRRVLPLGAVEFGARPGSFFFRRLGLADDLYPASAIIDIGGRQPQALGFDRLEFEPDLLAPSRHHAVALPVEGNRLLGRDDSLLNLGVPGIPAADGLPAPLDLFRERAQLLAQLVHSLVCCVVFCMALVQRGSHSHKGILALAPQVAVVRPQQVDKLSGKRLMFGSALSLAAQLSEPRLDLLDDDGDTVDVVARRREPVDRLPDLQPEAFHVRSLIEERAAFFGRHAQHLIDKALAHDRVAVLAHVTLHQEVDDVP